MKHIFLFLILIGQFSFAQNKTAKDSTKNNQQLEEVIVTANRGATKRCEIPVSVSKITPKTISETKPTSVHEVINKTSGVLMVNLGNEQHAMAIRQPISYSSYFLYLEDGLPIRPLGVFNHNALLEINQFSLNSIEVVKGPVSSIYGPEAIGGTINFITQNPTLEPTFKIGLQADQFGYKRMQVAGGATVGKFGFYLSGLTSDQKNSWLAASDYDKNNINLRLDYAISSKTKLIGTFMQGKYYSQMSGSVSEEIFKSRNYSSTTNFSYRRSDALRTSLRLNHNWNDNSESFITIFHRDNKLGQNPAYGIRWNPTASGTNNPNFAKGEINSNNFKSYGILGQHSQKFNFLHSNLIIGGLFDRSPNDYYSNQINLKANLNTGGQTVNNYQIIGETGLKLANYNAIIKNTAGYIQYSFNVIDKLKFTLGTRYDQMNLSYTNNVGTIASGNKNYSQLTSKIGANFNLTKNIAFYTNYAQGFAPPALSSIFRKKPNTGIATIPAEFYYNLEPAKFNNYEIGGFLNLFQNKLTVDYAIYYLQGKNELLSIRQIDGSTDYQSAGETSHKGIEFGVNYCPTQQWHFRVGGTTAEHKFIDFKVSDRPTDPVQRLDGFEMPQAPKWVSNSEVSYYPKWLPNLRTSIEWQYVSSYYQDQINSLKYEGYNFFNARIGYTYKGLEFYTNIMNLTDKLYAYNVSKGNNTTDKATYTVSAPRAFMFGIEYKFNLKK
ncbi:TonB-dependent receptor [Flavobacterium psychrophilum]|uniref:Probable TonB-dependent outer membrane receptor n=5 Tax=Flavobacterium psychrophilum TaxID=96345 RepID=A6H0H9_FLAPJ|nr:TonB-dependent receptor [Flavobacterium psychrophilum]AIG30537.1 TonB-dependent receptor [Flavobacterium psychrophilum]AIG32812.1 TonB-dependent receptor [Flavobacterium psychrophilum]AIG34967.1 TonB-dependent receptor [Flavobacterium psychrophilum]AIG37332.1 TonB-dependent receptor [Flavobacterium psychrophilum]AIG39596.1 TonB-dependent receptor [Flavobacterium psychrophilum]